MSSRVKLKIIAVGALAIAAMPFSAFASALRDRTAPVTTQFSAEEKKEEPKKGPAKGGAQKQAPQRVAPRQAPVRVAPRQVAPREHHVMPQGGQGGGQKNIGAQKKLAPVTAAPRIINNPSAGGPKTARKTFTPRGANSSVVSAAKIRSAPARGAFRTSIRGRNYSVWRSGYRARYHGGWRTFVGIGTLGALAIGANEYYPYAYIDAPEDYCDGLTEDGCQLVFDEVPTEEGDLIGQCVAYCPWQ
jgi:hypothetical protein